jgi:hypothetical protein
MPQLDTIRLAVLNESPGVMWIIALMRVRTAWERPSMWALAGAFCFQCLREPQIV